MDSDSRGPAGRDDGVDMRRQRLSAAARRASILQAASTVFERTGDLGSTTTKMIALEAGVNEAMLYRHFDSKEALFYASVVEPLHLPITEFINRVRTGPRRLTRDERLEFLGRVMSDMIDEFAVKMSALGLVLFGAPETSRSFYHAAWEPAIRELADGWKKIFEEAGLATYNDPYISAQVVVGSCVMLALEKHHQHEAVRSEDEYRAICAELARMMYDGVFAYDD